MKLTIALSATLLLAALHADVAPSAPPVSSADASAKSDDKSKAPAKPAELQLAPTHANVPYGTHERQVLDFWQTKKSSRPAPVLFFIHGGGWVAGDKSSVGFSVHPRSDRNKKTLRTRRISA